MMTGQKSLQPELFKNSNLCDSILIILFKNIKKAILFLSNKPIKKNSLMLKSITSNSFERK